MRLVKGFFLFIITILFIAVAWKNNSDAQLSLWPFSLATYTIPVFVIILFSVMFGVIITLLLTTISLVKKSIAIKRLKSKNNKLEQEVTLLKIKENNVDSEKS